jgi:hypothetical protein
LSQFGYLDLRLKGEVLNASFEVLDEAVPVEFGGLEAL